jgi:prophage regulatory protein
MVIIGWKQLKEMQPYSRQHISRLEKARNFPQRVRLGQNRVGWVLEEVEEHLQRLADKRDIADTS